ncbi:MAG TPA: hypothetical protein VGV85_06455, partial [Longimicrobiaceae bacterium]|nr:hypothetical protein [Longimicrobiaceae bacterium]
PGAYGVDPQRFMLATQTLFPAKQAGLNSVPVTVSTTGPAAPWPQGFGVGPMAVDPSRLTSDHQLTVTRDGHPYPAVAAAAVLGRAPNGLWLHQPDLRAALNGAPQVDGVVVGLMLAPDPPVGGASLPVDVRTLLYEAGAREAWDWGADAGPSADPFGGMDPWTELTGTIADPAVAAARSAIVANLIDNGFGVNGLIHTAALTDRHALGMLDPPVLNLLGENPSLAGS